MPAGIAVAAWTCHAVVGAAMRGRAALRAGAAVIDACMGAFMVWAPAGATHAARTRALRPPKGLGLG